MSAVLSIFAAPAWTPGYRHSELAVIEHAASAFAMIAKCPSDLLKDLAVHTIAGRELIELQTVAEPCPALDRVMADVVLARACLFEPDDREAINALFGRCAARLRDLAARMEPVT